MASLRSLFVLCLLLLGASLHAEQFGRQKWLTYSSPDVRFEYPDNWDQLSFPPPTIAAFSRDAETSFTVTRHVVDFPQVFNEVFTENETNAVRELYPGATQFKAGTTVHKTLGPILQIDVRRTAPQRNARPSFVRHFSVPVARSVYRVVWVARADRFDKDKDYAAIFDRMMSSFLITPLAAKDVW